MPKYVPYLSEEQIERDAAVLLAEFEQSRGIVVKRHVPIEDIVEKHLKLGLEFDDMHRRLNIPRSGLHDPNILGAMFFDERRIVIDESLDPAETPSMEADYRFTLAHEGGHWRLHRRLFARKVRFALFNKPAPPSLACHSVEWQADCYAKCLLMPRKLVMAAWEEMFPDRKPRVVQPRNHLSVWVVIVFPLADQFLVSPGLMFIRLFMLGLLRSEVMHQRGA
jgi:hypothetical protein